MGYSASQVSLLALTSRKADIAWELEDCSLKKQTLTRDMSRVTKNYHDALNTKVYKWSNNSGVSYSDISYSTLMRPSQANGNKPYLLTNQSGKVVLDSKYKKYAEMISPNGAPGGDWESNRAKIISELTGISPEKIKQSQELSIDLDNKAEKINKLQEEVDNAYGKAFNSGSVNQFLKDVFGNGWAGIDERGNATSISSIANDYSRGNWWSLGSGDATSASNTLNGMIDTIYSRVSNYLDDEDLEKFKEACETTKKSYKDNHLSATDGSKKKVSNGTIYVSASGVIDSILGYYLGGGKEYTGNIENASFVYTKSAKGSANTNYQTYLNKKKALDDAKAEYKKTDSEYASVLTSSEEQQIKFYDEMFQAIALQGWTYDENIEDSTYLNEMLQNNQFLISTLGHYDTTDSNGQTVSKLTLDSSTANDCYNLFLVNDSAIQSEALAKYEYEKSIINEKETRVDRRMKNLETEQAAIQKMIEGRENVRDENGERNFSIFT